MISEANYLSQEYFSPVCPKTVHCTSLLHRFHSADPSPGPSPGPHRATHVCLHQSTTQPLWSLRAPSAGPHVTVSRSSDLGQPAHQHLSGGSEVTCRLPRLSPPGVALRWTVSSRRGWALAWLSPAGAYGLFSVLKPNKA